MITRSWLMLAMLVPAACDEARSASPAPLPVEAPGVHVARPAPAPAATVAAPPAPAPAPPTPDAKLPGMTHHSLNLDDDLPYLPRVKLSPAASASVRALVKPLARECAKPVITAAGEGQEVYALAVCERQHEPGSTVGGELFTLLRVHGDTVRAIAFEDPRTDPMYPDWLGGLEPELVFRGSDVCAQVESTSESRGTEVLVCAPRPGIPPARYRPAPRTASDDDAPDMNPNLDH